MLATLANIVCFLLDGPGTQANAGETASAEVAPAEPTPRRRRTFRRPADVSSAAWQRQDLPFWRRWRPERNVFELGVFGGAFFPSERHDLYEPITAPPEAFWLAAPDVGVRLAYFPLRALGVETEFSAVPARMRTLTNDWVFAYGFRGHVVAQLPFYSITPFFLAGYGLLGVRSHVLLLGDDIDPAFHYGGGVKVHVTRRLALRVEARNIISAARAQEDSGVAHVQVLGGLTFTFGRAQPRPLPAAAPPPNPDRDRDGIRNEADACPDNPGVSPHGCPDSDGDTIIDTKDACPEVPGVPPTGCPVVDGDNDGIPDEADQCPEVPETWNGHEDEDGCPDELPEAVKAFTGSIPGIEFAFNEATIEPSSIPTLERAAEILREYPALRVTIVGHTDDVGTAQFNMELSRARAEAVATFLVEAGIDADRIESEGRGATQPVVPNTSPENRALNRRIEFEILSQRPDQTTPAPGNDAALPSAAPVDGAAPADETQPESAPQE